MLSSDAPTVPTKPSENCLEIEKLDKSFQDTISALQSLFAQRPVWTRRALRNTLKLAHQRTQLRFALPYVGYLFRSGPWRDAIVRFGYDPRISSDSRIYQTMMFRIFPHDPDVARDGGGGWGGGGRRKNMDLDNNNNNNSFSMSFNPSNMEVDAADSSTTTTDTIRDTSHIFSGHPPLIRDGRIWMLCDITDPLVRKVVFPENENNNNNDKQPPPNFLRPKCEIYSDGWYQTGTLAKARTIMRSKIQIMIESKQPINDDDYVIIAKFPDFADFDNDPDLLAFTPDPSTSNSRDLQLSTELRANIRSSANWRACVALADANNQKGKGKLKGKGGGRSTWRRSAGRPTSHHPSTHLGGGGGGGGGDDSVDDYQRRVQFSDDVAAAVKLEEEEEEEEGLDDEMESEGEERTIGQVVEEQEDEGEDEDDDDEDEPMALGE